MMRKSALLVLTLLAALWLPTAAWAELGEIRVGVDGMTCVT